ncbi:MAG: prolyl oligopeptidase family serine peptidase [Ginsengibacter sp.]
MPIQIFNRMQVIKNLWLFLLFTSGCYFISQGQVKTKAVLDHAVYDGWQEIGAKEISNNGSWVAYTIKPQEGNEQLVVYNVSKRTTLKMDRSSDPVFTADHQFLLFRIHPDFKDVEKTNKEKNKKKEGASKDTLAILNLRNKSLLKIPGLMSFQVPKRGSGWIAYHVRRDSIKGDHTDTLFIFNLKTGEKSFFSEIENYLISDSNNHIALSLSGLENHSRKKSGIALWFDPENHTTDTLNKGAAGYRNFVFDSSCNQLAYLSQQDTNSKEQKLFSLHYYRNGERHDRRLTQSEIKTRPYLQTINANRKIFFSKNGGQLFFYTVPVVIKDTLHNSDRAKVDVWRYNDDYLFTRQQKLMEDSARGYLAMVDLPSENLIQLADKNIPTVLLSDEGKSDVALGVTDKGDRISSQWRTNTLKTAYLISLKDGSRKKITDTLRGEFLISSSGNFVIWYNGKEKNWFAYNVRTGEVKDMTQLVADSFYDVEYDQPEFPPSYGIAGWTKDDRSVLLYGRYDIWQIDPAGEKKALNITNGFGQKNRIVFRVVNKSKEQPSFSPNQFLTLNAFYESNKQGGFYGSRIGVAGNPTFLTSGPYHFSSPIKARDKNVFIFTRENFVQSPDLYVGSLYGATRISDLNPQQQKYNWGTASLVKWETYDGKPSEGILYKPEDFDSTHQYPMIVYFYEKLTDRFNYYIPPEPTPSRLNISFFVSRGYLVFTPDISYTIGHPGKSAYDYIMSGVRSLLHHSWIDSTRIGIQGQSWGGYQTAYLITQTPLFKAAWAGAPVVDMFSAYGGIRWGSGVSRQFQYEHGQSRIGATIWERPDLYIENSPLFFLPRVHTPLVIMANDHDEKVPWYQGIELFTDLRRLGKPVWMLNYLGEKHNLVKRKNRKDISIKEQEFFDHFLKGAPLPDWMQSAD